MKKIVIIGSPGAGKSTLAQELGRILDIEVIHLDRYFWQPGWKEYSRQERITIEQKIINTRDQWIIEGSYLGSSDNRLRAADTIIFLDTPYLLCLWRVATRYIKSYGITRSDLPEGCTDRFDIRRIAKILHFPLVRRKWLLAKVNDIKQLSLNTDSVKNVIVLTSNMESKEFLKTSIQTYLATERNHTQNIQQYAHAQ